MAPRSPRYRILLWEEPPLRKTARGLRKDRKARPVWVACCLEHFMAEQGETPLQAWRNLRRCLAADLENEVPDRPAPRKYLRLWRRAWELDPHRDERRFGSAMRLVAAPEQATQ